MTQKLTDNEWGFSVEDDNPFLIFTRLQKIAKDSVGEDNMIDLSRGDPGYGFTPSVKGRRFFSYLVMLDTFLNNDSQRYSDLKDVDKSDLYEKIVEYTKDSFSNAVANELLKDFDFFIEKIRGAAKECGLEWSFNEVLKKIFQFCPVSGGSYLDPKGEEIVRVVLAQWYRKFISTPMSHEDLIIFQGASHAIGTIFKALGNSGIKYLNGDGVVAICSPAYAPYNLSLYHRGIKTFALTVDPYTGKIGEDCMKHLEELNEKIQAIILIDPNNPTGFAFDEKTVERIANVAKKHDSLIISDEVYTSFFPKKKTIVDFAPERTLRIDARSKIERSTGIRFGDMFIPKEANKHISEKILKLLPGQDIKSLLIQAKGPGGIDGELQHTTFVPGPSQFLGMCHVLLGEEEREKYFDSVHSNSQVFVSELGLPHKENLYYVIFDFDKIGGAKKKNVCVEEKLIGLAKLGVVYLPINLFFSELERVDGKTLNMVRASVVNTNAEKVKKAAQITKEYLTN